MKIAVKKDGHQFYTHINQVIDHATSPSQPNSMETNEKKEDFKGKDVGHNTDNIMWFAIVES